jgi:hypothetical protein
MDGVWLPAGGRQPDTRGFPDSRHTPRPGIAKGVAFSPLARRRSPQVNRSSLSVRRNRINPNRVPAIRPFSHFPNSPNPKSSSRPIPNPLLLVPVKPKPEAVCRAEGWGEWSRCAVRMTVKGSVTPWMACGSRPVEGSPALGSFPDSRHTPRPGVKGAGPFAPLPTPPTGGWQIDPADRVGTGSIRFESR